MTTIAAIVGYLFLAWVAYSFIRETRVGRDA